VQSSSHTPKLLIRDSMPRSADAAAFMHGRRAKRGDVGRNWGKEKGSTLGKLLLSGIVKDYTPLGGRGTSLILETES